MPFTATPGQSRPNTKKDTKVRVLTIPSSNTQTHCCGCQFSCGPEVLDCLSQSPVVSPCEWLRFSGLADIPNKLTEGKCGRRTGRQKQTFPLSKAWILSNTRDYSFISPMLTISR